MSQVLFSAATTPQLTDLDANFTELYALRNLFTITGTNPGFGTTPNAWNSSYRAFDFIGTNSPSVGGHDSLAVLTCNAYVNSGGAWTFSGTGAAAAYTIAAGTSTIAHVWNIAASGTGGTAITWTQAMKIDLNGNVFVGTGTTNPGIQLAPTGAATFGNSAGATGFAFGTFARSGVTIGSITQSGTTAVLYNTTSDQRLKDNITDAADAGAVLDAVQVRQFDWRSDGSHQRFGFIAQELVMVVPEAVHSPADQDDMMAVDYSKLVPLLVKEVQRLRARLAAAGL